MYKAINKSLVRKWTYFKISLSRYVVNPGWNSSKYVLHSISYGKNVGVCMSHVYVEVCSPFSLPAVSFPAFLYWLIIWLILRLLMRYRRPFDKVLMFSRWSKHHPDLPVLLSSILLFTVWYLFIFKVPLNQTILFCLILRSIYSLFGSILRSF